jgi:hypothetical protein
MKRLLRKLKKILCASVAIFQPSPASGEAGQLRFNPKDLRKSASFLAVFCGK